MLYCSGLFDRITHLNVHVFSVYNMGSYFGSIIVDSCIQESTNIMLLSMKTLIHSFLLMSSSKFLRALNS